MVNARNTDLSMAALTFQMMELRVMLLLCNVITFITSPLASASCRPDLTDTEITWVPRPEGGVPCNAVFSFNLSHRNISEVSAGNFTLYPKLVILNLAHNRISTLEDGAFTNVSELEDVDLTGNPLVVIGPGAFANLTLKHLSLESCQLVAIGPDLFNEGLSIQRQLILSGNLLRYVPKNTFDSQREVKFIDLSRNKIEVIHGRTFAELGGLSTLNLSSNDLSELPNDLFSGLINLKEIDVSNNWFHPRATFSLRLNFLNSVITLHARNCNLETLPKILGKPGSGSIRMYLEGNPLNDTCKCDNVLFNLTEKSYSCNNGSLADTCFDKDIATVTPTERDKRPTVTTTRTTVTKERVTRTAFQHREGKTSMKMQPEETVDVEKKTSEAGGVGITFNLHNLQVQAISILPWAVIVITYAILGIIFLYKKREGQRRIRNLVEDVPETVGIEMKICDIE